MLGSTTLTAILGAAPPADAETARLKSYAKAAVGAGLALLLIAPGTKEPVDMRSTVQRRKDDAEAVDAAQRAGRPDYLKARSKAGSHLATTDPTLICRYIDAYRKTFAKTHGENCPVNFAIEVGRSGIVIVDCDTAEQVTGFMADCDMDPPLPPTVRTPGAQKPDGTWIHKDGGHYWFTTETSLQGVAGGSYVAAGGYAVMWDNRYVLIPPSVRPEGVYSLAGREYPLPGWIAEEINQRAELRLARMNAAPAETGEFGEAINAWAQTVDWSDLLAPAGWTMTGKPDRCGCDVWTAPGDHSSPKSATAHDTGCDLGRYTVVNAPLHIWTDNPGEAFAEFLAKTPGSSTLSKLQVAAIVGYKGDVGTACAELGVLPSNSDGLGFDPHAAEHEAGVDASAVGEEITLPDRAPSCEHYYGSASDGWMTCVKCGKTPPDEKPSVADCRHDFIDVSTRRCADCGEPCPHVSQDADGVCLTCGAEKGALPEAEFADDAGPDEDLEDGILNSDDTAVPKIAPFSHWRSLPPPEYAIEGLIEHRALSCVVGPPGVGKSTFAIDIACSLVTGQRWQGRKVVRQRVLYLPGEGLSGAVQRIKAWEQAHGLDVGADLMLGNAIIQLGASKDSWAILAGYILQHRVGLIIFDTFARMSLGLEENSASDVGKAITRFDQIRKLTGSGVMVIHHTGKVGTSGRGSNALNGALDSELLLTGGEWDASAFGEGHEAIQMNTSKQKNAPRLKDPMPLMLTPMHDSVVLTGPSGVVGDPLDSVVVAPLLVPEPVVETAIRLQEFAVRFPSQGVTRGELRDGVVPDEYAAARRNPAERWKRAVAEAVDLGLRYELLETLTGRNTGTRYVAGATTPDAARRRAAEEAMAD